MVGFVGRTAELGVLAEALRAAETTCPVTVAVEGPAGIGKTTLLDRFVAEHPVRCLRACGVPWERERHYGVLEQLLAAAPSGTEHPTPGTDVVAAGGWLLSTVTAEPSFLLIDDAHTADEPSLKALASGLRRTRAKRLLVLLGVDTTVGRSPGLRALLNDAWRVQVAPLSARQLVELSRQAGIPLPRTVARMLAEHTDGNPGYATALLRELPADTWLEWHVQLPAPTELLAEVGERLADCGAARDLVEAAAALGDDCSFQEAATLAGGADPIGALDQAQSAGLLHTCRLRGQTVIRMPNPMVRSAVLQSIGPRRLTDLHMAAADIVADEGEALSHRAHATLFADDELADELVRYADARVTAGAWSAVGDALIKASRLTTDRESRRDRLLRGVDAIIAAGRVPEGVAFLPEIESFPESPLRNIVLAYLEIMRGRPGDAETWLDRAWARCDPTREPETAAVICQRRVLHALARCQPTELVRWADRALAFAPSSTAATEAAAIRGLGLAQAGNPRAACEYYTAVTRRVPAGAQTQRVLMGKGWVDAALDDPHTARTELESAVPTGFLKGSRRISLWAKAWLARTQFVQGNWDEALETVNRAGREIETTGLELIGPLVHWTGVQVHALRGEWAFADEHLRASSAAAHDYEIMIVPAAIARAQYAEARADYDEVVRALAPLLVVRERAEIDEPGFWPWADVYANAQVMINETDAADAFLAPHEQLAGERVHRSWLARLGCARGRVHAAQGNLSAARQTFEAALRNLDGLPLPYDTARVHFAYGQTLRRAGKRREADAVLQTARELYAHLGAHTYVQRCDQELQASGLGPGKSGDTAGLTAQEHAVATLVAHGMSNKEAAGKLFVSVKTVQFHLTRIYAKLGVRTRSELAAKFSLEHDD